MSETAPAWMSKHPCESCDAGYGFCAQWTVSGYQCCKACSHPGRWASDPWTAAEYAEMWEGKNPPPNVQREIERLATLAPTPTPDDAEGKG